MIHPTDTVERPTVVATGLPKSLPTERTPKLSAARSLTRSALPRDVPSLAVPAPPTNPSAEVTTNLVPMTPPMPLPSPRPLSMPPKLLLMQPRPLLTLLLDPSQDPPDVQPVHLSYLMMIHPCLQAMMKPQLQMKPKLQMTPPRPLSMLPRPPLTPPNLLPNLWL